MATTSVIDDNMLPKFLEEILCLDAVHSVVYREAEMSITREFIGHVLAVGVAIICIGG